MAITTKTQRMQSGNSKNFSLLETKLRKMVREELNSSKLLKEETDLSQLDEILDQARQSIFDVQTKGGYHRKQDVLKCISAMTNALIFLKEYSKTI